MQCPRCGTVELKRARTKAGAMELDICPKCHGYWFDKGELEQLLQAPARKLRPRGRSQSTRLDCPACGGPMREFLYPRTFVAIDRCWRCHGIWLDAGEFKEIDHVRSYLKRMHESAHEKPPSGRRETPEPGGVKGALIRMVNSAIAALTAW